MGPDVVRFRLFTARRSPSALLGRAPGPRGRIDVDLQQVVIDAGRRLRTAFPIHSVISVISVISVSRPAWTRRGNDDDERVSLVASGTGVVRIILNAPARARRLGQQIAVRQFTLSVDDPDLLAAILTNRGNQQQRRQL